jgi:O-acetylhomoserine (thiol)-lyase
MNVASKEEAFRFIDNLKIIKRSTNLYDNKTLVIHPASTLFSDLEPAIRASIGVEDTMIRLSVGIEDLEDLVVDIDESIAKL